MTSFFQLFGKEFGENNLLIDKIEIPLIQRDYAQGRHGIKVERIRNNFLDAICTAVIPDNDPVGLDFIYGDVIAIGNLRGTFFPLDGQQRLTTLFLLHWYIALRAGIDIRQQLWTNFTYATRPGARTFCGRVVEHFPKYDDIKPYKLSEWLKDQHWYLYTWQHDPTIQSMLVMLDAIDQWFKQKVDLDYPVIWNRLTDQENPAVYFNILPMTAHGLTADLYIKMNSRGIPLTDFENFKAHFEALLKSVDENSANDFSQKIDTKWSDCFWHYRGDDNIIDDEFMRYFRFITDVIAWIDNVPFTNETRTDDLADKIYGNNNPIATDRIKFMIDALDTWAQVLDNELYIKEQFEELFTATQGGTAIPLLLFNTFNARGPQDSAKSPVDMFGACCQHYGEKGQVWTLAHTLFLYAVLLDRIYGNRENRASFPKQLRILRNLIESSIGDEIKREDMSKLLSDVKRIIVDNMAPDLTMSFNKAQIQNEISKLNVIAQQPELQNIIYKIEDHKLLKGCLAVFDLNPAIAPTIFSQRVEAFHRLFDNNTCWHELTGALLAIGDYSRKQDRGNGYYFADFGAPQSEARWRDLFKGKWGENPHPSTDVLMNLLDQVSKTNNHLKCLQEIQRIFTESCENNNKFDWRYYFVKYPAMREGAYGRYVINFTNNGYHACMLNKSVMYSYYRDPYLLAIMRESTITTNFVEDPWFRGYETEPRKLNLKRSGIQIECVQNGWQITEIPVDTAQKAAFDIICKNYSIGACGLYAVTQNNGLDSDNRIKLGSNLLKELIEAGL